MVSTEGYEPPTYSFVNCCSIQLSYADIGGQRFRGLRPHQTILAPVTLFFILLLAVGIRYLPAQLILEDVTLPLLWRLPSATLRTPALSCDLGATHLTLSRHNLVEITGIEPVVGKPGGFTVHCITIDASSPKLGGLNENRTRPYGVTGHYTHRYTMRPKLLVGCLMGNDPILPISQNGVRTSTLQTPLNTILKYTHIWKLRPGSARRLPI